MPFALIVFGVTFLCLIGIQHSGFPVRGNEDGHFESNVIIKLPLPLCALLFWNRKKRGCPIWLLFLQIINLAVICLLLWNRVWKGITVWDFYHDLSMRIYGILFSLLFLCTIADMAVFNLRKRKHKFDYYDPDYKTKKK
jgi:hypothetical protein